MGIDIKRWLIGKLATDGIKEIKDVTCEDLKDALDEVAIRELAFQAAVNLIANAVSKCEFKTFVDWKETRGEEHYLWNVEPNVNQNSSMYLHDLIDRLFRNNEALVIESRGQLVVADSFEMQAQILKESEFTQVQVGDLTFNKKFKQKDVLYFKLNPQKMKPVLDAINIAHAKLIDAARKNYSWTSGNHWIAHVAALAQGDPKWQETFAKIQTQYMKPFLQYNNAVLPEFEGYTFRRVGENSQWQNTRDVKSLYDDIFELTSKAFGVPAVLLKGEVAGIKESVNYMLTFAIDPLCDMLQEEINRKRYGFEGVSKGRYIKIDTSVIKHFDWFDNASNVDKLISSGALSINEVRVAAGENKIDEPWANEHFITKNYGTVENMTALGGGE